MIYDELEWFRITKEVEPVFESYLKSDLKMVLVETLGGHVPLEL